MMRFIEYYEWLEKLRTAEKQSHDLKKSRQAVCSEWLEKTSRKRLRRPEIDPAYHVACVGVIYIAVLSDIRKHGKVSLPLLLLERY
jgi:hypothetical protein